MAINGRNAALVLVLCLSATQGVRAQDWTPILKNSALGDFTAQDLHLLSQEGKAVLDGAVTLLEWRNPSTGAGGSFKLLDVETSSHWTCKRLLVQTYSAKFPAQPAARVRACRTSKGPWKLAPTSASNPARESGSRPTSTYQR